MEAFKTTLFNTSRQNDIEIRSLRKDNQNIMSRTTTKKKNISDIFYKLRVMNDKITCKPLELNGEIL